MRSTVPWGVLQIDPCDQDRKAVRIGEMLPSRRRARKAQPASSTPSTSAPVEASVVTAPQAANHKVDLERWWRYAAIPAKTTMAILTSSTAFQADGCPECTESGWALVRQDLVQPGTHRTGAGNAVGRHLLGSAPSTVVSGAAILRMRW